MTDKYTIKQWPNGIWAVVEVVSGLVVENSTSTSLQYVTKYARTLNGKQS